MMSPYGFTHLDCDKVHRVASIKTLQVNIAFDDYSIEQLMVGRSHGAVNVRTQVFYDHISFRLRLISK